ncbi:helix-turn-helix domain-containing protein [Streptomyces telluris]|uniref:Helix-turn-helix domain-containing protein n=1 Tax=Streptomyces telluris TaxID=2720021 RepID=A0A9X2LFV0_9ACTN|nr:helix-turn-helix transcriptional regulator [Streptomyces telluris]MCQ8770470.1 helix-turn-helix domain-containing protein [Streptomyces telluris]NJP78976.1 helix-turn-helix transcriptional regulator [Streptomyces telluris]
MTKQQPPRPTRLMGDHIRAARETRNLSTQTASAQAEISSGYLFKLENGYVGTPSPRVLHRLSQVLGLDYWELMGLAGYVVPTGDDSSPAPAAPPSPAAAPAPLDRIADALEDVRDELRLIRRALEEQRAASPGETP